MQQQQNIQPNTYDYEGYKQGRKSPQLCDLIRENISYQHDQTIKKTLMKESLMKISMDKDFKDLFKFNNNVVVEQEIAQDKCEDNFIDVTQQIKEVCQWLEESQQYAGMAYVPLTSYTKLFHVLHQKIDTTAIIVTEYPIHYLAKMETLNRLSKLRWAFLNSGLDQQDKVKIFEMYELKKLKLLFVSPSMLKNEPQLEFESELLVICDFEQYRGDPAFVNNIILRTKPGRVLGIYPTLLQNSMQQHISNNFHYINKSNSCDYNLIALKCSKQQKQKSVITYLNKNPLSIQKTLILINKRAEAINLTKKMTMDAKATVNLFDYVSSGDLNAFNMPQLFTKADKIKEQDKIQQALKKIRSNSQVIVSTYSDILKFQHFDLVVFFSFTDVKKFIQTCPSVKNKLLLFDEEDYHNTRNILTSQYLNNNILQKHIIKIIQKPLKKENQVRKRFYSDYIDDKMLNKYSLTKQIIEKDEQKNLRINSYCKSNGITQKNFMRIVQGLVQVGMVAINCRAVYQIQIDEQSISYFRKTFPKLEDVRRKVNVLDSSATLQVTTKTLLQDLKKANIRYKIIDEALQFKVLKNYQDINWNNMQSIINKKLMQTVKTFDLSLDILRQCAYSSIQLTRRQKVLLRKQHLLQFSLSKQVQKCEQSINDSFHKSNLLTSQIQQYIRNSDDCITDQHQLVMLLQGVERGRSKEKEQWIFARYRKMKYQELAEAVIKIFKNKKVKI